MSGGLRVEAEPRKWTCLAGEGGGGGGGGGQGWLGLLLLDSIILGASGSVFQHAFTSSG